MKIWVEGSTKDAAASSGKRNGAVPPVRICMVATVSLTVQLKMMHTALRLAEEKGWQVTLVCADDPEFSARLPACVRFYPVPMSRGVAWNAFLPIWRLWRFFRRERFQIVRYSTPNAALYASVAAWCARIPIRIYGQWGLRYVGYEGWRRKLLKCCEWMTCRLSTHIRPDGELNRQFAIREGLYAEEKAKVLGAGGATGVDLTCYDIARKESLRTIIRERYKLENAFVFGFVGRLTKDKGMQEILQAIRLLAAEYPNVRLLCVGADETPAGSALMVGAKHAQIILTGGLPAEDLPAYYAAMDCYVHPSYREGFAVTIQEAGAMACPIIATRIPGAMDVMEEGVSCLVVEPRNVHSLLHAMRQMLQDADLRTRLGRAARQRVEKHFERDAQIAEQLMDYQQILNDLRNLPVQRKRYSGKRAVDVAEYEGVGLPPMNECSGQRKTVCFVATTAATLQAFVLPTAQSLTLLGWHVTLVCADDILFSTELPATIRFQAVPMRRGVAPDALRAMWRLWRFFRRSRFNIVQYSTPNAAFYAAVAARLAGVPARIYGQWGIRYVGYHDWRRSLLKWVERATCSLSTHIRPVSPLNRQFAIKEKLFSPEKAKVLGAGGTIGVDLQRYDLARKDVFRHQVRMRYDLRDVFVFGFVGRLTKDKGTRELLEAFAALAAEHPEIRLLCVGMAETRAKGALLPFGVSHPQVIFTGYQPASEIAPYYAAMDCYVHPSYREGFGMSIQEAGAMACAIITTRIPGASEVMEEGVSCLLAEPRDAVSLKDAMRRVLEDEDLRAHLGLAARKRVEQYFERQHMIDRQLADYQQILGECAI